MKQQKNKPKKLDFSNDKNRLRQFITYFQDYSMDIQSLDHSIYGKYDRKKYMIQIQKLANFDSKIMQIMIEDMQDFFRKDDEKQMLNYVRVNTLRYLHIFQELVAELMPQRTKTLSEQQQIDQRYKNYIKEHREKNIQQSNPATKSQNQFAPRKLYQNYNISIIFGPNAQYNRKTISEIKSENIGQLVATRAIVVRASDIKPQLLVATYVCDVCGYEIYHQINDSADYKPITQCNSTKCKTNLVSGKITFLPSHSKFRSYQQLKIQQTPEQLLRGAMPKSTRVQLRGNLTSLVSPGDIITVQGIILPKPFSKSSFSNDMLFNSYFYVMKIVRQKKKYIDFMISEKEKAQIKQKNKSMDDAELYGMLARSIAPEIYGLEDVKKALLLQMAGGLTVTTQDHLRIRGEINIALFGDPGIAKSQLLKHISYISPRAVYTTGKGSSGVGLTAAIVTDPFTKELALQAGALVLADMGVCCIDEFDKMDQIDRTAIHQVMEQQTVSITKAGIITTLNARTSVLAAANPLFGRYNKKLSTQINLNLPAALLSRFDLIFILLDQADKKKDYQLALHIGQVHQKKRASVEKVFSEKQLKNYIALARQHKPILPQEIHQFITEKYIEKRQQQMDRSNEGQGYTTMRSLLALIRLSTARAKLRFSDQVSLNDVNQSLQIIEASQIRANLVENNTEMKAKQKRDPMGVIFDIIKSLCNYDPQNKVDIEMVRAKGIYRGFTLEHINNTIQNYANLNIISISNGFISLIR